MGPWLNDPAANAYAAGARKGNMGGVFALVHRANNIAYALVRDQNTYDGCPTLPVMRWRFTPRSPSAL